jgi:hypothetical protein
VSHDERNRAEQHRSHDDGIIAPGHTCDEAAPDTGYREDALHHERPRDEPREQGAKDGHHRDERIPEGVVKDRGSRGKALGARGPDVVFIEHLQHAQVVHEGVLLERGDNAQRDADQDRDHERQHPQLEGDRELRGNDLVHRPRRHVGWPEITVEHVPEIVQVLFP